MLFPFSIFKNLLFGNKDKRKLVIIFHYSGKLRICGCLEWNDSVLCRCERHRYFTNAFFPLTYSYILTKITNKTVLPEGRAEIPFRFAFFSFRLCMSFIPYMILALKMLRDENRYPWDFLYRLFLSPSTLCPLEKES